jgi:digeranylgeranylglycerophospholipid reductase
MIYDAAIIGAGPAGSAASFFLSQRGYKVIVIERSRKASSICGEYVPDPSSLGIEGEVGSSYSEFFKPFVVNELRRISFKIFGRSFKVDYLGYSIKRSEMVEDRLERAQDLGADVRLGESFITLKREEVYKILTNEGEYFARYVIGADGFPSRISRFLNGEKVDPDDVSIAFPIEAELKVEDPSEMKLIFDEEVAPGAYAWIIPRGDSRANVGLGIRCSMITMNPLDYMRKFLSILGIEARDLRGRFVPVGGLVKRVAEDGIFLLGDAAGMVIPSNGGGIHNAIISAYLLSKSLESELPEEKYTSYVNRYIRRDLEAGLTYRRAADVLLRLGILEKVIGLLPRSMASEAITGRRGKYYPLLKIVSYLYPLSKGRGGSRSACKLA